MVLFYVTVMLLMLSCTEVCSQKIVLEFPQQPIACFSGLRRGRDRYIIHGNVGPKYLELLSAGWESKITMEVLTMVSIQFIKVCLLLIGPDGIFCDPHSTSSCYCDHLSNTGIAYFVISSIAKLSQSLGIVRAAWMHSNGTSVYSQNNITLPKVYDQSTANLMLKVNGHLAVKSGLCGRNFIPFTKNTVELCCYNTASPCYPRLIFNTFVVAENDTECVNFTFTLQNESYTVNLTKSYSVCNLNESLSAGSCMIKTEPEDNFDVKMLVMSVIMLVLIIVITFFCIMMIIKGRKKVAGAENENPDIISPVLSKDGILESERVSNASASDDRESTHSYAAGSNIEDTV